MSDFIRCELLSNDAHPLATRFYRNHNSGMKVRSRHQTWVIRDPEIIACLCLQPMDRGYWLTSLLVSPGHRNQGKATTLLSHVRTSVSGPIWLFCNPTLQAFYERSGFNRCSDLPEALADRLARYQRSKQLMAMRAGSLESDL